MYGLNAENYARRYWAEPFRALCSKSRLVPFVVLDVQPVRTEAAMDAARNCRGKFTLVEVTVARPRDVGDPERSHTVISHLGNVLQAGDTCLGYDLENAVLNDADMAGGINRSGGAGMKRGFDGVTQPVVLIRKVYRRGKKTRKWTLKRISAQQADLGNGTAGANDERDFEEFMQVRLIG